MRWFCALWAAPLALATTAHGQFQNDDIVLGLSNSGDTLGIIRGGEVVPDPFTEPFIQRLAFDNTDGIRSNANGNVLGTNFGTSAAGGSLFLLSTDGSGTTTRIGDFSGAFPAFNSLSFDNVADVSVSPDNTRIAVTGPGAFDPDPITRNKGNVWVFDYDPAAANATDVLSNPRELGEAFFDFGTHATAWLDNDTLMLMDGDAGLFDTVDVTESGFDNRTSVHQLLGPNGGNQPDDGDTAGIVYNPDISPYVFVGLGDFASGEVDNFLWVLDPENDFEIIDEARYDSSLDTAGDVGSLQNIAMLSNGNIVASGFAGTVVEIDTSVIGTTGLVDDDVTVIVDGATAWDFDQDGESNIGFNGIAVALTGAAAVTGDADGDGDVDAFDLGIWQTQFGQTGEELTADFDDDGDVDAFDLGLWQTNFGTGLDGAAVPEPATLGLLMLGGLAALRRRR